MLNREAELIRSMPALLNEMVVSNSDVTILPALLKECETLLWCYTYFRDESNIGETEDNDIELAWQTIRKVKNILGISEEVNQQEV